MSLLRNLGQRVVTNVATPIQAPAPVQPGAPRGISPVARPVEARGGQIVPAMPDLPADFVKNTVDSQDRIPERARVGGGYTHVSSLVGICTRMHVLAARRDEPILRPATGGHRVMWRMGRGAEAHVREQFIRGLDRRNVYGEWRCRCGKAKHEGFYPRERKCEVCDGHLTEYHEAALFDHENKIVGNPDLKFTLDRYMVITEIKSMNKAQWEELSRPLGDHVFQAAMYNRLERLKGGLVHDKVSIIYVLKDFKHGSPYKEFHVDITQPHLVAQCDEATRLAAELRDAHANETLPGRICPSASSSVAKQCAMCVTCFNLPG